MELRGLMLSFFSIVNLDPNSKKKLKLVLKQMNLPLSDIKPDAIGILATNMVSGILMVIQIVILNWYIRFPR